MMLHRGSILALFPERRLFFAVVCLGGLLGFYLLSILPHQQATGRLEGQIEALQDQINEQKLLGPIYERFTSLLAENQPERLKGLPLPVPGKLTPEQVADIETFFRQLADQSGLRVRRVGADLNSMINEMGELRLSLELLGSFSNLRDFMLKLGGLPYLTHIERIDVRRETGIKGLHMALDVWLARE
jgi:hypothetical protein